MASDQEAKFHRDLNRGSAAEFELNQTDAAFEELRKAYIDAWEASDSRDTAGREKLWVAMTILSKVRGQLKTWVRDGQVAKKELDALRTAGEPRKRFGVL